MLVKDIVFEAGQHWVNVPDGSGYICSCDTPAVHGTLRVTKEESQLEQEVMFVHVCQLCNLCGGCKLECIHRVQVVITTSQTTQLLEYRKASNAKAADWEGKQ